MQGSSNHGQPALPRRLGGAAAPEQCRPGRVPHALLRALQMRDVVEGGFKPNARRDGVPTIPSVNRAHSIIKHNARIYPVLAWAAVDVSLHLRKQVHESYTTKD